MNRYYNPVRTLEGPGSLSSLPEILNGMEPDSRRILLLVWSEEVLKNPAFSFLLDQKSGFQTLPFSFQASNPTVEQLFETYEATKEFAPAVVIAVGGGSIMDVGKSLCCLYGHSLSNVDALRELIVTKAYGTPAARWIGIPTTAGTGSETTCWATIWDPSQDAKRSVECHKNYAWAAVVDSDLTKGMPLKLAVSSGLDAAAHGVESYWAKGTNQSNGTFRHPDDYGEYGRTSGRKGNRPGGHGKREHDGRPGIQQHQNDCLPLHLLSPDHALLHPPRGCGQHAAGPSSETQSSGNQRK